MFNEIAATIGYTVLAGLAFFTFIFLVQGIYSIWELMFIHRSDDRSRLLKYKSKIDARLKELESYNYNTPESGSGRTV